MKAARVNITDHVQLQRIDLARRLLNDPTATKTAMRLVDMALNQLGIPLVAADGQPIQGDQPAAVAVPVTN